ncbi:MAG: hypothetical protein JWQ35_429 [Bacteriovoracaceae bacterium]|nr:hypothetical protein [Bacteriovoracaceae bacterium]
MRQFFILFLICSTLDFGMNNLNAMPENLGSCVHLIKQLTPAVLALVPKSFKQYEQDDPKRIRHVPMEIANYGDYVAVAKGGNGVFLVSYYDFNGKQIESDEALFSFKNVERIYSINFRPNGVVNLPDATIARTRDGAPLLIIGTHTENDVETDANAGAILKIIDGNNSATADWIRMALEKYKFETARELIEIAKDVGSRDISVHLGTYFAEGPPYVENRYPDNARSLAFEPNQRLLAVGIRSNVSAPEEVMSDSNSRLKIFRFDDLLKYGAAPQALLQERTEFARDGFLSRMNGFEALSFSPDGKYLVGVDSIGGMAFLRRRMDSHHESFYEVLSSPLQFEAGVNDRSDTLPCQDVSQDGSVFYDRKIVFSRDSEKVVLARTDGTLLFVDLNKLNLALNRGRDRR